jgi:hypothetical protein
LTERKAISKLRNKQQKYFPHTGLVVQSARVEDGIFGLPQAPLQHVTGFHMHIYACMYVCIYIQLCTWNSALMSHTQESNDLQKKEFAYEGIFGLSAKEKVSPGKTQALHV